MSRVDCACVYEAPKQSDGINGLEAGQCFIMSCAILAHNFIEMSGGRAVSNHLFSAQLMMPFTATTLGMLYYNWYPSCGDTWPLQQNTSTDVLATSSKLLAVSTTIIQDSAMPAA
eukprot:9397-Heterococcus_DN1.PRE.1